VFSAYKRRRRNAKVLSLIEKWANEPGDYDEGVMKALDRILKSPREYMIPCICKSVLVDSNGNGLILQLRSSGQPLVGNEPMDWSRESLRLLMDEIMGAKIELLFSQSGSEFFQSDTVDL